MTANTTCQHASTSHFVSVEAIRATVQALRSLEKVWLVLCLAQFNSSRPWRINHFQFHHLKHGDNDPISPRRISLGTK